MARIRTIKPEFFTSENIVALSPLARLLYVALWCEADKEGRLCWRPRTFKMRYLPGDECDIEALCEEMVSAGLVVLYGDGFAHIPSFLHHQHINPRESKSLLPDPYASVLTRADASNLDAHSADLDAHAQVGREGKGRSKPPVVPQGDDNEPAPDKPTPTIPCPYDVIVDAYHEMLPSLPRAKLSSASRQRAMRTVWGWVLSSTKTDGTRRANTADEAITWLRAYFERAGGNDFLMGRTPRSPGHANWLCDLDFLLTEKGKKQVIERTQDAA